MAAKTLSSIVGGVLKSVQRGQKLITGTNLTANATITAVDLSKAFVIFTWKQTSTTVQQISGVLSSTTNILFARATSTSTTITIEWEVVEYE